MSYVTDARRVLVDLLVAGSTQRLTYAHKGGRLLMDDPISAGVPSYVMQEEFNRYQGYWWQPACSGLIICSILTHSTSLVYFS